MNIEVRKCKWFSFDNRSKSVNWKAGIGQGLSVPLLGQLVNPVLVFLSGICPKLCPLSGCLAENGLDY